MQIKKKTMSNIGNKYDFINHIIGYINKKYTKTLFKSSFKNLLV